MPFLYFTDDIKPFFEVWILGDKFLQEVHTTWLTMEHKMMKDKKAIPFYMYEYYNVEALYEPKKKAELAIARMVNSLTDSVNAAGVHLPRLLIIVPDRDILHDLDINTTFSDTAIIINELTRWLV